MPLACLKERMKTKLYSPNLFGLLFNPNYISRLFIYNSISEFAGSVQGQVIIDLGCGTAPYRKLFKGNFYVGIDVLKSGNTNTKDAEVIYDGTNLPIARNCCDIILLIEVVEHVKYIDELMEQVRASLKDGGIVFLTAPFMCGEHEMPFDFRRLTSEGFTAFAHSAGFEILKLRKLGGGLVCLIQMFQIYAYLNIFPKKYYIRNFLTPIFLAPLTIIGLLTNNSLFSSEDVYLNSVVVLRKI